MPCHRTKNSNSVAGFFLKKKLMMNNIDNEHWKDIDGYDGMYQVSDLGRVRSKKYGRWKVLKNGTTGSGYLTVCLFKDNKVKGLLVHRLVASAFIPNTDETKTIINHINEDKTDNRVENLEWCDYRYNLTYNDIHHRRIVNRISSKYKQIKIKDLYDPNITYAQNLELFRAHGVKCSERVIRDLRKDLGLIK